MLIPSGLLSKSYLTYFGKKLKKEIKKNTFNLLLLVSLSQGQMQHIFHYFLFFFIISAMFSLRNPRIIFLCYI